MSGMNGLKMPDEYTEFSYGDGELSGSGHKRWSAEDTQTAVKWGVSIIAAGTVIGLGIKYRTPIRNGISYAWNQITGCCRPEPFDSNESMIQKEDDDLNEVDKQDIQEINDSLIQINIPPSMYQESHSVEVEDKRDLIITRANCYAEQYNAIVNLRYGPFEDNFDMYRYHNLVDDNDNLLSADVVKDRLFRELDDFMAHGGNINDCRNICRDYVPIESRDKLKLYDFKD